MVSPGLIYACHPNDRIIKEVLDSYEKDVFQVDKVEQMITIIEQNRCAMAWEGFA